MMRTLFKRVWFDLIRWIKGPVSAESRRSPGEILDEEFMLPGGLDDHEMAELLDISDEMMDDLLLGLIPIDRTLAEKLSKVLYRTTPEYWLSLQQRFDTWRATELGRSHVSMEESR